MSLSGNSIISPASESPRPQNEQWTLSRITIYVRFNSGAQLNQQFTHVFGNAPRFGIWRIIHVPISISYELIGAPK
jgi:hypothetical protein